MPPNQVKISVSLTTAQKLYSLSIIIFMLPTVPFSAEERDQLKELPNKECILIMKHLRGHCVLHVSTYPAVFLHLANRSAWQGKQKNPLPGISGHHLCICLQLSHHTGRRKCELDLLTIYMLHSFRKTCNVWCLYNHDMQNCTSLNQPLPSLPFP